MERRAITTFITISASNKFYVTCLITLVNSCSKRYPHNSHQHSFIFICSYSSALVGPHLILLFAQSVPHSNLSASLHTLSPIFEAWPANGHGIHSLILIGQSHPHLLNLIATPSSSTIHSFVSIRTLSSIHNSLICTFISLHSPLSTLVNPCFLRKDITNS